MEEKLTNALEAFAAQARPQHWYGKTYAQFWAWFSEQEQALLAQASPQDTEQLQAALLELTADCDDAGFAAPPEWDDRVIQRPN